MARPVVLTPYSSTASGGRKIKRGTPRGSTAAARLPHPSSRHANVTGRSALDSAACGEECSGRMVLVGVETGAGAEGLQDGGLAQHLLGRPLALDVAVLQTKDVMRMP